MCCPGVVVERNGGPNQRLLCGVICRTCPRVSRATPGLGRGRFGGVLRLCFISLVALVLCPPHSGSVTSQACFVIAGLSTCVVAREGLRQYVCSPERAVPVPAPWALQNLPEYFRHIPF